MEEQGGRRSRNIDGKRKEQSRLPQILRVSRRKYLMPSRSLMRGRLFNSVGPSLFYPGPLKTFLEAILGIRRQLLRFPSVGVRCRISLVPSPSLFLSLFLSLSISLSLAHSLFRRVADTLTHY